MAPEVFRGGSFLCLHTVWWGPAIPGVPWLAAASFQSLPPSSRGILPVCLSAFQFPSSYKDTSHIGLGPTLVKYDLILT